MDETIVERIITLMESYGLSPSAFADKVDVQRSSMSHLVSGRNKPSLDFIQKILNKFSDINPTWLIMGTGPMKQLALFDDAGEPAAPVPIPAPAKKTAESSVHELVSISQQEIHHIFEKTPAQTIEQISSPVIPINPMGGSTVTAEKSPESTIYPNVPLPVQTNPVQMPLPDVSKEKSPSNDKKVTKIVFFYSDNTFETFNPQ
ncbi:MAG: helix-turn-helix transcriptional regulator [Cytophagales bacterium]|nr:helix-turn-helix transcriptional regulator [Cytophaga sp.]